MMITTTIMLVLSWAMLNFLGVRNFLTAVLNGYEYCVTASIKIKGTPPKMGARGGVVG
jgi:hypothetical protein